MALVYLIVASLVASSWGQPEVITVRNRGAGYFGIEYNDFLSPPSLISSTITKGMVARIDDRGYAEPFVTSRVENTGPLRPEIILSTTLGLKIFKPTASLWIINYNLTTFATNDFFPRNFASLVRADAQSGEILSEIILSEVDQAWSRRFFPKDLAIDSRGNIYIPDALNPRVFILRAGSTTPEVLFREEVLLKPSHFGITISGVAVLPTATPAIIFGNFLGQLFRATVEFPQLVTEVKILDCEGNQIHLDIPLVTSIVWHSKTSSLVVGTHSAEPTGESRHYFLKSSDEWRTAMIVEVSDGVYPFSSGTVDRAGILYSAHGPLLDPTMWDYHFERIRTPSEPAPYPPRQEERSCGETCLNVPHPEINFNFLQMPRSLAGNTPLSPN